MTLGRFVLTPAWALAGWLFLSSASAFPGVLVDEDGARRLVNTTHVVVVHADDVSVVTIMIDYEGPLTRFALLLPVPSDVETREVHTLRREIVTHVEEVSAPRMHEFFEKAPCEPGEAEQAWEQHLRPHSRGFLTPLVLPPPDASYRVSNEMSVPSQAVFKGEESEFSHTVLDVSSQRDLERSLAKRGLHLSKAAASKLVPRLRRQSKLLLSEVKLDRVELVGNRALQLGGIRYTTRGGLPRIESTLGLTHSPGNQDLFVYVLDAEHRFEAANYPTIFSPTNVAVEAEPRLDVGAAYNALFDHAVAKHDAFVCEYAWPTEGCGEPCPNAPLQLRELLSLGGDELEARRAKMEPPAARKVGEAPDPDEQALAERRALIARQRYLLTRLHYRYRREDLPNDVELRPARDHAVGGVGVPSGPSAELSTKVKTGTQSRFQTRFFSAQAWSGTNPCKARRRWRWGRRWKSMGRVSRRVPLGLDLPRQARDPAALRRALVRPIAGIEKAHPEPKPAPRPAATATPGEAPSSGCNLLDGNGGPTDSGWTLLALGALALRRWRGPRPQRPSASARFTMRGVMKMTSSPRWSLARRR